jgi:hypothetical protein
MIGQPFKLRRGTDYRAVATRSDPDASARLPAPARSTDELIVNANLVDGGLILISHICLGYRA